jgi:hypothetical protein
MGDAWPAELLTKWALAHFLSCCALAAAASLPARAADSDPVAPFVGHYRSGPGFPLPAVERMPVEFAIERVDDDIVVRFVDPYQSKIVTEIVFADSPSPFHLIERTAEDVSPLSGFLRATGDLAMIQRSDTGQGGRPRQLRLLLHRHGDGIDLVALTSNGSDALAFVSRTLLRLRPAD